MGDSAGNVLGQVLTLANQFATPFAKTLDYGNSPAQDIALTKERAEMEMLNGSGPTNPDLAVRQTSRGLLDFLYGNPAARGTEAGQPGNPLPLILIAVLGIVALVFFVRR